ncbi:MAG TPA: dephospho-CoA kinase, partial [Bacteroidia bacterium]|nr:dephospho-CoA kinase [Bacteroidia bacterium]
PAEYSKEFVLKEAAILFEAGSYTALDGVIMVYAPIQVRLERVCKRDGVTDAQIRARMTNQWPDSTKLLRSDFVIYNDGIHHFSPQVTAAIQHFNHL